MPRVYRIDLNAGGIKWDQGVPLWTDSKADEHSISQAIDARYLEVSMTLDVMLHEKEEIEHELHPVYHQGLRCMQVYDFAELCRSVYAAGAQAADWSQNAR